MDVLASEEDMDLGLRTTRTKWCTASGTWFGETSRQSQAEPVKQQHTGISPNHVPEAVPIETSTRTNRNPPPPSSVVLSLPSASVAFVPCPLSGLIGEGERAAGERVATPDMKRRVALSCA